MRPKACSQDGYKGGRQGGEKLDPDYTPYQVNKDAMCALNGDVVSGRTTKSTFKKVFDAENADGLKENFHEYLESMNVGSKFELTNDFNVTAGVTVPISDIFKMPASLSAGVNLDHHRLTSFSIEKTGDNQFAIELRSLKEDGASVNVKIGLSPLKDLHILHTTTLTGGAFHSRDRIATLGNPTLDAAKSFFNAYVDANLAATSGDTLTKTKTKKTGVRALGEVWLGGIAHIEGHPTLSVGGKIQIEKALNLGKHTYWPEDGAAPGAKYNKISMDLAPSLGYKTDDIVDGLNDWNLAIEEDERNADKKTGDRMETANYVVGNPRGLISDGVGVSMGLDVDENVKLAFKENQPLEKAVATFDLAPRVHVKDFLKFGKIPRLSNYFGADKADELVATAKEVINADSEEGYHTSRQDLAFNLSVTVKTDFAAKLNRLLK